MRVIGVGLNRTGTTSLALALEDLGFGPCYHLRTLNSEPYRAADWIAAERDPALTDWEQVFQGFESAVGCPASAFWREITSAFRSAKVILTVRPADNWYESVGATITEALAAPPDTLQWPADQQLSDEDAQAQASEEFQARIWQREIGGDFRDRDRTIEAFDAHIAHVRANVPASRLLVYSVRQGWGPLCEFLGRPEPQRPFPRENDRATFRDRLGLS